MHFNAAVCLLSQVRYRITDNLSRVAEMTMVH